MKKKKWYRSVSMKGNLLVLQYLLLGAFLFCGGDVCVTANAGASGFGLGEGVCRFPGIC